MSDYEWGDDSPVGDEMSVVAEHTGSTIPGGPSDTQYEADDFDLGELEHDYSVDSGDGGDYANEPQHDPLHALAVEAFEQQLTQQEQFDAWKADYAERHNAAMEAKWADEAAAGVQVGDQIIGNVYGGQVSEQDRHLVWAAAEALKEQEYSRLQREGHSDQEIGRMCLEGAANLVREVGISALALKKA